MSPGSWKRVASCRWGIEKMREWNRAGVVAGPRRFDQPRRVYGMSHLGNGLLGEKQRRGQSGEVSRPTGQVKDGGQRDSHSGLAHEMRGSLLQRHLSDMCYLGRSSHRTPCYQRRKGHRMQRLRACLSLGPSPSTDQEALSPMTGKMTAIAHAGGVDNRWRCNCRVSSRTRGWRNAWQR
jgi:hypothetical protein